MDGHMECATCGTLYRVVERPTAPADSDEYVDEKVIGRLLSTPDGLSRWWLMRRVKEPASVLDASLARLVARCEVREELRQTTGRAATWYHAVRGAL